MNPLKPKRKKNPHAVMLGRIKSPRRAEASKRNGRLGGRIALRPTTFSPGTLCAFCQCLAVVDAPDHYPTCRAHRWADLRQGVCAKCQTPCTRPSHF